MNGEEFAVSTHQPERLIGPNYLLRQVSLVEIKTWFVIAFAAAGS